MNSGRPCQFGVKKDYGRSKCRLLWEKLERHLKQSKRIRESFLDSNHKVTNNAEGVKQRMERGREETAKITRGQIIKPS